MSRIIDSLRVMASRPKRLKNGGYDSYRLPESIATSVSSADKCSFLTLRKSATYRSGKRAAGLSDMCLQVLIACQRSK